MIKHSWLFAVVLISVIWGGTAYFAWSPQPDDPNQFENWRGTFGDAFGAATSLFSALALIGVAYGVSLQRNEIDLAKLSAEEVTFQTLYQFAIGSIPQSIEKLRVGHLTGTDALFWLYDNYSDDFYEQIRSVMLSYLNVFLLCKDYSSHIKPIHLNLIKGSISSEDAKLLDAFMIKHKLLHANDVYVETYEYWFSEGAIRQTGGLSVPS